LRWQAPQACTARLSRRLFPEYARHNLDSIIERHRIHCASRHRAMPDAAALWQFWQQLRAQKPLPELDRALQATLQHSALPPQLSTQLAGELPESTGVYCFYGAAGGAGDAAEALLYVGKANNLRERVLSHFSGAHRNAKSQRLTQQTQRIDWIETAGEWQALLHESELVQQQQPVYNRRLRGGEVFSWRFASDATAPELVSLAHGVPSTGDCFGLYRNARAARKALHTLAQEQQFCLKVLGLEPGPGSCFGYQLQRCRGACVGTEAPVRHALRLRLAWARSKLATWPFAGPVAVAEQARGGWFCLLVLDRFRYLGALRFELHDEALSDAELRNRCAALLRSANSAHFDADRYRIIVRLLRQRGARQRIVPLHSESVT
jgi:DNA polymerase-3 subunit epsilon